MGFRFVLPCIAAFAALVAPALWAQDNGTLGLPPATTPRPAQPERQGPEIDVFRDPAIPAAPVAAPAATAPPPVAPTVTPALPPTPAAQPRVAVPTRQPPSPQPPPVTPAGTPPERDAPRVEAIPPAPAPVTPAPARPPAAAPASDSPWGWIAGALALLLGGIGAWLFLRPAPRARGDSDDTAAGGARAAARPVRPASPTPPDARARLSVALVVEAAQLSFTGVAVRYRLTLDNHGDAPARDIMVHVLLGSADAEQRALLQQFFAGTIGAPLHSVVEIAAGKSHVLHGDVRMDGDAIVPVTIDAHPLLIPLIAFDVQYRWGENNAGSGRTGAAFIVGQEQEPVAARLAPFRIDLGPRPFRRPGVRAAGEPLLA